MSTTRLPAPDLEAVARNAGQDRELAKTYRLVADCFVNPDRIDRERLLEVAWNEGLPAVVGCIGEGPAEDLKQFLEAYESMTIDEYVSFHELSPACPLYLGHHAFEQPQTCRDISGTDRNQYMVELNAIYKHYGFEIGKELPDFLPAMVEFCLLSLDERGDELRAEFQRKGLTLLPAMQERAEAVDTPYRHLLEVIEGLWRYDLTGDPEGDVDAPSLEKLGRVEPPESVQAQNGGDR